MRENTRFNCCFLCLFEIKFRMASKDKEVEQDDNFYTFKASIPTLSVVLNALRDNMER